MLITLVSGKPAVPIAVSFTDNSNETFNKDMIEQNWVSITSCAKEFSFNISRKYIYTYT